MLLRQVELWFEGVEDFSGDVSHETAHDCFACFALFGATFDVVAGLLVVCHSDERDAPEGAVGFTVAALVESVGSLSFS
jgi:hypothetical protein